MAANKDSDQPRVIFQDEDRNIEFIRREYTARRIFLDYKEAYSDVEDAIFSLKYVSELIEKLEHNSPCNNPEPFDTKILNMVANGTFSTLLRKQWFASIEKCINIEKIEKDIHFAYELSVKYGYIISDMGMNYSNHPRRTSLLETLYKESIKFKETLLKSTSIIDIPHDMQITFMHKNNDVRFYGSNATPWHRVRSNYVEECEIDLNDPEFKSTYECSVSGFSDNDFNFEATISKISLDICSTRVRHIFYKKLIISDALYINLKHKFKINEQTCNKYMTDHILEQENAITLESYQAMFPLDRHDEELLALKNKNVTNYYNKLKKINDDLSKELIKLKRNIEISIKRIHTGRYKQANTYAPRFAGLCLWDLRYFHGMKLNKAIQTFKKEYLQIFGCSYTDEESNPYSNLCNRTDDCIQTKLILPMKGSRYTF
ncbi:hypothetical protein LN040_09865 [Desulfovibrio subterraneus]|uniref:hypothetical protein n=1 Tax=Desulfovibrio subterraneus TaxID=2718620 RepID=UPI0022B9218E|nr:hypothetical protein [Desulfovibrio subterraneus]WBF66039.1 hypothetical protein LN040_09865 [Desulfovibrio subterraneus]